MVKTRSGADLTKSSCENKRAYNARGETTMSLIPGDSLGETKRFILTKLSDEVGSKLSKSVVSLVLSDADKVLFACSGIAIDNPGWTTRFLAPKSLVRALNDSKEGCGNLKIEVHLEGGEVHIGSLSHFCSDQNFAVVNVMSPLDVHVVLLEQAEEILPHSSLVAVGRDIFGKLITKSVILTEDISRFDDPYGRIFSNHKSDEAWEGGALFDCAGNFVGMNIFLVFEKSFFLPRSLVVMGMRDFWASRPLLKKRRFPYSKHSKAARPKNRPTGAISNCHLEENFGDEYGKGFWMELSKRASTNINRSVVALASFSDHTRLFTCTGFFIEWNGSTPILTSASLVRSSHDENKICENMRIEVLLPNKQRVEGTLQHYCLHYNIALVSVKNYRALWPADIEPRSCGGYCIVASVGRCFNSGTLMAANGMLTDWSGTLDCKVLAYSTCKITKVGIGGPLVGLNGKFLGMNFIHKKIGTPFVLWYDIAKVLSRFKKKGTRAVAGGKNCSTDTHGGCVRPNRWPVPNPGEDDSGGESNSEFAARYGCSVSDITYVNGERWFYR